MINLKKESASVSSRAKRPRISSKKIDVKNLNSSELLSTILKERTKERINTKFPMTLNGKHKKKTKQLPKLHISVDENWREIYSRTKTLNIKIYNAGESPAYNAFLEIYTTPTEIIKRGASLSTLGHFQQRTIHPFQTIYPNKEVLIPIYSPGLIFYGALFEPYFFMCYDILQDPKTNIQITEYTEELNEHLINSALENRKLLYLEPVLISTLQENKPTYEKVKELNKHKLNLKARR